MTTFVNGTSSNKNVPAYTSYFNAVGTNNGSLTNFNIAMMKKNSTGKNGSFKNNNSYYNNISSSGYGYTNGGSPNSKRFSTEKKNKNMRNSYDIKNGYNNKVQDELDKSRIETLFDDDKANGIENVGKDLEEFITEFRSRYKEKFEENPEDKTQEGFQKIIEQLFDLQDVYYEDYKKASSLNNILKSYLISYSENFRYSNKKNNRLNEMFETLAVKREFSENLNRQDNQRINESIDIHKKELKTFKNIFKLKYDQNLVEKYKEEMRSEKCNNIKYFFDSMAVIVEVYRQIIKFYHKKIFFKSNLS